MPSSSLFFIKSPIFHDQTKKVSLDLPGTGKRIFYKNVCFLSIYWKNEIIFSIPCYKELFSKNSSFFKRVDPFCRFYDSHQIKGVTSMVFFPYSLTFYINQYSKIYLFDYPNPDSFPYLICFGKIYFFYKSQKTN